MSGEEAEQLKIMSRGVPEEKIVDLREVARKVLRNWPIWTPIPLIALFVSGAFLFSQSGSYKLTTSSEYDPVFHSVHDEAFVGSENRNEVDTFPLKLSVPSHSLLKGPFFLRHFPERSEFHDTDTYLSWLSGVRVRISTSGMSWQLS